MVLLQRKRRGASSSFGMFSKPSGFRVWGKCEMQSSCQLPGCGAGGHFAGNSPDVWLLSEEGRVSEMQLGGAGALLSLSVLSASTFTAGERGLC